MARFHFNSVTVKSNLIDKIAYQNRTLSVLLKNGSAYQYTGVPVEVAERFLKAKSKGKFFNSEIKGNFDSEQLEVAS